LHGIPIGLKDNIDTAGIPTTAASAVYADRVPQESAEVVRRLEEAGAIILGKLNMHEFAFGATSAISHFGPVRNPWNLERVPGGSSGGSGAAVAARLCAGALGTDTGGSIRIPAAHCGIVGLKPTYGLASIRGIVPMIVSQDHVGPMCRSVADTALMLQALAGYDPGGIASINVPVPQFSKAFQVPTGGLRLGIPRAYYQDVDAQILAVMERALELLLRLSGSAQDVTLPQVTDTSSVLGEVYEYHAQLIADKRELYQPLTLQRILQGSEVDLKDYVRATYELKLTRKAIERTFEDVDLLITPTMTALPVTIDEAKQESENGRSHIRNTMPFNLYGIPSISIPCGFSSDGLPMGLQISGPALGEVNVLALAYAYEQATKWHEKTPALG
jgi:aspartyl-tRNA(Asn)/glutamyl-tRNA(Gln) amidotransferase subunit A